MVDVILRVEQGEFTVQTSEMRVETDILKSCSYEYDTPPKCADGVIPFSDHRPFLQL